MVATPLASATSSRPPGFHRDARSPDRDRLPRRDRRVRRGRLAVGILAIPVAVLSGSRSRRRSPPGRPRGERRAFVAVFRFMVLPMFLFSGTFFPVASCRALERWPGSRPSGTASTLCRDAHARCVSSRRRSRATSRTCSPSWVGLLLARDHLPARGCSSMTRPHRTSRLVLAGRPAIGGLLLRAQRHGLPPDVDDHPLGLLRAALLPPLARYGCGELVGEVDVDGEPSRTRRSSRRHCSPRRR